MKILITGNLGYVGPWVTRQLRASYPHATLVGLDMGFFAHCLTNAAYVPEARLDLQYFGDVRQLPAGLLEGTDAIVESIWHAVDVAGIDHVGLGSDFDGAVPEPFDATGMVLLTQGLLDAGFDEAGVAKVMGGNVRRLLADVLP